MSATCVPWNVPPSNTGLSKHGDPVFLHLCPLNQNLGRVGTGGGYRGLRRGSVLWCRPSSLGASPSLEVSPEERLFGLQAAELLVDEMLQRNLDPTPRMIRQIMEANLMTGEDQVRPGRMGCGRRSAWRQTPATSWSFLTGLAIGGASQHGHVVLAKLHSPRRPMDGVGVRPWVVFVVFCPLQQVRPWAPLQLPSTCQFTLQPPSVTFQSPLVTL